MAGCFYFSDLQVDPQFLTLRFIDRASGPHSCTLCSSVEHKCFTECNIGQGQDCERNKSIVKSHLRTGELSHLLPVLASDCVHDGDLDGERQLFSLECL